MDVAALVREHTGTLLRAALGLGFTRTDAEELVQATFVAFLEAAQRFEGRSSIRTFLFGILYKKALEQRRRRVREVAVEPDDALFDSRFGPWGHWSRPPEGPDRDADRSEAGRLIQDCLDRLSDQQRAAFQLKEVDGQANAEICNILGVADTHLRVLLFRARNRLRECLEKKWG